VIFDTTFLIAIQGRKKGFSRAQALEWMKVHGGLRFFTGRICELEFASGFATDSAAAPYLQGFTILPVNDPVLREAAEIMRDLRAVGQGIGVADSIIAATARLYGLPIVTDNTKHFKRVPGLVVRNYMP
jgi:predicted nucleic acid-binding protein